MQKHLNTALFLVGVVAVFVMLLSFDISLAQVCDYIRQAGYWLLAAVLLWGLLYALNALTMRIIIQGSGPCTVSFGRLWQIVVTGFALNTTVPVGGIGGEPYRIMELSKYIGVERATSTVVLYAMTHVFSHFFFWLTGIVVWLAMAAAGLLPLPVEMCYAMLLAALLSAGGIWLFSRGYKFGLVRKAIRLLGKIPGLKNWSHRFEEKHSDSLSKIDAQIAQLHAQRRKSFYLSLGLEYVGRLLQSLEVFFILLMLGFCTEGTLAAYLHLLVTAFLVLVFTSLFANLIGFIPLQLGGREGGFTLSVAALGMTAEAGFVVGIICRVREIIWATIGLTLMKLKISKTHKLSMLSLLLLLGLPAGAQQLTGVVTDAETGEPIPFASVIYKGHNLAKVADINGGFSIERHTGWNLTVSAVGYKERIIPVSDRVKSGQKIALKPDNQQLKGVTIKAKRQHYSRKNNPAVELMRKVIAAKKLSDLKTHDFYEYHKYQKLTMALNDLTPEQLEKKPFSKHPWLVEQVEKSQYNDKLILPLNVNETVSQHIYRKHPHSEKTIIQGENSTGVNDLFQTGDIIDVAAKDVFTDVNIYDEQIRLLQYPFTSPIGKDAIAFYRYYIEDTLKIERDSVIHLHFLPNNQQDFGFRGDLYILKDSSYHVRRCEMTLPKKSDVNWVDNLHINQEFSRLDNGEWVLTDDDMIVELTIAKFLHKAIAIRTTRLTDYSFDELPKSLFKGKRPEVREADAPMRGDDFWTQYRQVELTKSESGMDRFLKNIEGIKGIKYAMIPLKALIENFVETGTPSKVDLGPMNTILTHNHIDGYRVRASAQTTANLHPRLFLKGYAAHGFNSHKNYYDAEVIWSLNKKEYLPREFPKRTLSFQSTYDVGSASDRFVPTDKDNFLTAFKWATVDKMMFYNRQQLTFEYEADYAWKTTLGLKTEETEAAGTLHYLPMAAPEVSSIRTTELHAEVRYAPGETYVNTKQRRLTINLDAPTFILGHTTGVKGLLGGDYNYNFTEMRIYKRFWMNSWGKIDCYLKGGVQWNKVPFPLLSMPAANLSYLMEDETFNLVNNMEFLNDRWASLMLSWDLNGKLLNRLPLIRKLKWREFVGINMLWGTLTDKNNPTLASNAADPVLMQLPEGCYIMDSHRPYAEAVVGIHNIFKLLHVEYVRRLNYNDLPTSKKWGMRYTMRLTF